MLSRTQPLRRTRLRRSSSKRAKQNAAYLRALIFYLGRHPYCQCWIARHEIDEHAVIGNHGFFHGKAVPYANSIHHRNKRDGERLLDERWWMAICDEQHRWIEAHKEEARLLGYLLPIQANSEGQWGIGNQALTTPEFMASKARRA